MQKRLQSGHSAHDWSQFVLKESPPLKTEHCEQSASEHGEAGCGENEKGGVSVENEKVGCSGENDKPGCPNETLENRRKILQWQ